MKTIELLALVDDDDTFVYITKKIIEKTNCVKEIKVFNNGLEAIVYLKENKNATYLVPDVIFLDLSMPIMDGWQFLDEFITLDSLNTRKIIIYVCSSSISPYDMTRAKNINVVSDFIIKPITKDKFTNLIMNL